MHVVVCYVICNQLNCLIDLVIYWYLVLKQKLMVSRWHAHYKHFIFSSSTMNLWIIIIIILQNEHTETVQFYSVLYTLHSTDDWLAFVWNYYANLNIVKIICYYALVYKQFFKWKNTGLIIIKIKCKEFPSVTWAMECIDTEKVTNNKVATNWQNGKYVCF